MKKSRIKLGENDIKKSDIVQLNLLLRQMDLSAPLAGFAKIKNVMKFGTIVTLRNDGVLIGMGTLVPLRKVFSFYGIIEDVVVEESYRGRGLGKKILRGLIKKSKKLRMKFVDLTSNPKRKNANNLYPAVGFEKRKTNAYRLYNF